MADSYPYHGRDLVVHGNSNGKPFRVYQTNGEYVVAESDVWLPGVYDTTEAAVYALGLSDQFLHETQERKNAEAGGVGGTITLADLKGTWGPVFNGPNGTKYRALALTPTHAKVNHPIDFQITDELGTWRLVRVDEMLGGHPTDQEARGEWSTRRATYELDERLICPNCGTPIKPGETHVPDWDRPGDKCAIGRVVLDG
jgi:hypothetical protein